jgi:RNA polymerase primary sigma factor
MITTKCKHRRLCRPANKSTLETYLGEINDTPLLTAEQEKLLAIRIQAGDIAARDHMVRANLRLVVNIAGRYTGKGVDYQDLIAEGNLGLFRAAEDFDPVMGTRFSTYAFIWIRQAIRRAIVNTGKTIRLPAYVNELLIKWRRAAAKLHDSLGRSPTDDEIAAALGLSKKKVAVVQRAICISNAAPRNGSAAEDESADESFVDDKAPVPEAGIVRAEDLHRLANLLGKMDQREADVLRLHFGLGGEEPMTLKAIGERLGITRERVRQIEWKVLENLGDSVRDG